MKRANSESANVRVEGVNARVEGAKVRVGVANVSMLEANVPVEFLDEITQEIMNIPMILPSGKIVDRFVNSNQLN